jgi:Na+/melibiose symporter-like transporter
MEEFMIYLVLGLTILNSFMLIYFFMVQTRKNNEIIKELRNDQTNNQKSSDKNKAHIDDMLKMREMYESD